MSAVIEREAAPAMLEEIPQLFVVWIDTNFGDLEEGPDWEMNSPPQPLGHALKEAAECRAAEFPAAVWPEGLTPRADGLFTSPSH